jgi:hypothetical protein
MPRDRMYVRRFLNEPGHHGGAYLLLCVSDTEGARGSYVESSVRLEIADCARNVQLEFPLHDATVRRNSLKKARILSRALHDFERALTAESEVAAARERDRNAVRVGSAQASEWMVHVLAEIPGVDAAAERGWDAILNYLEHASASVGVTSDGFSVTLTVEAPCAADALRIGEWMVRATLAACGFDPPASVRAEIAFSED